MTAATEEVLEAVGRSLESDALLIPTPGTNNAVTTRLLVAFSGGPDSLALLWAASTLAQRFRLDIVAVHLDHALDDGSLNRATKAKRHAEHLGIRFEGARLKTPLDTRSGGIEAAARKARYRYLDRCRLRLRAQYVLTGHHADDQIETILLRILYGSGVDGLAGIAARRGSLLRPMLALRRSQIDQCLLDLALEPTVDQTNQYGSTTRNRLRNTILPLLREEEPHLEEALLAAARQARATRRRLDSVFEEQLRPEDTVSPSGVRVHRLLLERMPKEVRRAALSFLHRRSKAGYPGTIGAQRELERQLTAGGRIGIDCGRGWRWRSDHHWLQIYGRSAAE